MWNFINNIPLGSLDSWYRWLTIVAIALPILGAIMGGVCGWGAFTVSNRMGDLQNANFRRAEQIANAANKIAEQERLARLKLEQRFADRSISDTQLARIASKLLPFAPQEFGVTTLWEMKEPKALADRVATGLVELAKWKYVPPERYAVMPGNVEGILVYVHPEASEKTQDAAKALVDALNAEQIVSDLRYKNDPGHPDENLHLNVGIKPRGTE